MTNNECVPLSDLATGQMGVVVQLTGGRGFICRLAALGFTLGVPVTMMQNLGHGPLIVMVRDTRVALGRGEANKVLVKPQGGSEDEATD